MGFLQAMTYIYILILNSNYAYTCFIIIPLFWFSLMSFFFAEPLADKLFLGAIVFLFSMILWTYNYEKYLALTELFMQEVAQRNQQIQNKIILDSQDNGVLVCNNFESRLTFKFAN